jgi:hypothetical protein
VKVSIIEETRDLTKMTMDELHGTLTTCEMRTNTKKGHPNRETTFKATKKTRNKECTVEETLDDLNVHLAHYGLLHMYSKMCQVYITMLT